MTFNADEQTNRISRLYFVDDIRASFPQLQISFTVPVSSKRGETPDFSFDAGSRIIYSGISWIPRSYRPVKTSTTSWTIFASCIPLKALSIVTQFAQNTAKLAKAVNMTLSNSSTSIDLVNPVADQYLGVLMNRYRYQSFQQQMKSSNSVKPLYLHLGYESNKEVFVSKDFTTISKAVSGSIQFKSKLEASSTQISMIDDRVNSSLIYKRSPRPQSYNGYITSLFGVKLELRSYTDFNCQVGNAYTALTGIDTFIMDKVGNKVVCLRKVISTNGELPVTLTLGVFDNDGALLEVK